MSLRKAIESLIEAMDRDEQEAKQAGKAELRLTILGYANLLRMVLLTSKEENSVVPGVEETFEQWESRQKNKAREEMRSRSEEFRMVECSGGPVDGTMVSVSGNIKEGDMPVIVGSVYVYNNGALTYNHEETIKYLARLGR